MLMGISQGKEATRGTGGRNHSQAEAGFSGKSLVLLRGCKGESAFLVGVCLLSGISCVMAESEGRKRALEACGWRGSR